MPKLYFLLLLFLVGCASVPHKQKDTAMPDNARPPVCREIDPLGIDKIGDSFEENQKIWTDINTYYRDRKDRKLAVFLDGTGDDKRAASNVRALYRLAVKHACDGNPVIPYYDKGVGAKWFDILLGGAFGQGVSLNIRQAYTFLASAFQEGDKIYLFGFSRGAFTARSLNGFIEFAGLLDHRTTSPVSPNGSAGPQDPAALHDLVKDIYSEYHTNHDGTDTFEKRLLERIERHEETKYPQVVFRKIVVSAIGVFDTVPALGITSDEEPDNHRLDLYAERGFHALSLDEQRNNFRLLRFDDVKLQRNQTLHEVWFPGVHANVGGGYAKVVGCNTTDPGKPGYYDALEATPLNWMIKQMNGDNLFPHIQPFQECVDGRLHDEFFDDADLYKKLGIARRKPQIGDTLHESILQRIAVEKLPYPHKAREPDGRYQPTNLHYPLQRFYRLEK